MKKVNVFFLEEVGVLLKNIYVMEYVILENLDLFFLYCVEKG